MYRILLLIFVQLLSCGTRESPDIRNGGESYNSGISRFGADTSVFDYNEKISDLSSKLTEDFVILPHSCFVIASNLSRERTNNIIENTISNAEECFYNDYFEKKPDELITIFLFKDDASYRKWAEKLYGDTEDLSRFGYYKPSKKAMLMNINTGSGTLVHEMTHAFVRYDFPDIPSWFNEGLGSLYERCSMTDKVILGHVNWRLPELQDALKDATYSPISALIKTDDDSFYGDNSSFNYAQARYLCQYLQDKNLLKKFYKKFRDNFEKDKTGKKFLEEATGMKTGKLDSEFREWVKELKYEN
ncbi:MAG TPA: hypothetical protein VN514_04790 [Ignavibacteria bacterium]|nr:hypothetical protein [Ignavibacteria bacterium]